MSVHEERLTGRNQKNLRRMKFTCLICKEKFDNVLSLRKHMKSHLNNKNEFSATTKSYKINTKGIFQYLPKNLEKIVVSEVMYCFGVQPHSCYFCLKQK